MRAMDDAASQSRAVPDRSARIALLLVGALAGAILAIGLAPRSLARFEVRLPWAGASLTAADWPRDPLPGEEAIVRVGANGMELVVRAPEAAMAEALAREISAQQVSALPLLREIEVELRAAWRLSVPHGPSLPMTRESEVAALLLGEAALRRDLALQLPGPYAAAPAEHLAVPSLAVLERQQELSLAIPAADPDRIEQLLITAAADESDWLAASGVAGSSASERGSAWRRWQLARADSLSVIAERLLESETALQQSLAAWAMPAQRSALGETRRSSYLALARAQVPPTVPGAGPIAGVWAMVIGIGALTGAAAASFGGWVARRGRNRGAKASPTAFPGRDPGATEAWLHVVTGPDRTSIARAVLELASHTLARGERALIIDASTRLALHERLGREARWGLMECLHCDMPVLGLVQYGGWPGLYLLAHGETKRASAGWSGLGRRLDEAKPHFGRILFCVDQAAPRELGEALMGRPLEGWWAESGERLPRQADELPGRLGIAFSCIDMRHFPEVTLERLGERAAALAPSIQVEPAPVVTPAPIPPAEVAVEIPVIPEGPVVLDCDLQVQQRLRFLAWMRRVQSESRREELEPVA